ncbi:glycine oxidase ThiO [Microcoleus sp. FACHB-672]|nr:glycine oxidase ThiO [Microcoleus sp. FACHB-672]
MIPSTEILIIGGGITGLSIAIELKLRGASPLVLCRNFSEAATHAAAGMIAPQAEALPAGPMLDICLRSRDLYPDWTSKLEELSGLSVGYWPCGILAPAYEDVSNSPPQPVTPSPSPALWLDKTAINVHQPGLGTDVTGGWWFPEDGQVDNRALARALWATAEALGIEVREGVTVEFIAQRHGQVSSVRTNSGDFHAQHYVLATGAWSHQLLPVPVYPKKGQMLSLRMPATPDGQSHYSGNLQRVLYGKDIYIVPRQDGRLVIGATTEEVGFTPGNTPAGVQTLLERAIRLYPALQHYPIEDFWWGYRPATPDELPILGPSLCENLTLATGHYRNGILLAPATAALIADFILNQKSDPLLKHFHAARFFNPQPATASLQTSPKNSNSMLTYPTPIQANSALTVQDSALTIAGKTFHSRLMTGTGKYRSIEQMQQSVVASGCQIVTVAVRRVQTKAPGHEGLAEALDWTKIWMLPNTAGCQTAEEAIRVARLGREMAKLLGQEDNNFVKLEVIPDSKYLLPDPIGTLQAAEQLVKEGFAVLPYINADPMLAKRLEDAGCATVMPLGSPIGSGQGITTAANIQIIIENAKVPVVVDAGIGTPSEAAQAMEMGADALLINSAIAMAKHPAAMAKAMGMAAEAGRLAYLAGRMPVKAGASASSPQTGTIAD